MKNPYAAGFYALLIAICVISVCFFGGIWTSGRSGSTQDAFAFVNSVSALIQALAAGIVAALAYRGLTTWKQELIFGKCLSAVWDTSRMFRMIEKRINQLRTSWEYAKPKSTLRLADPVSPRYSGGVYESIQCNAQAYRKRLVRTYPRWNFEPSVQFINRKKFAWRINRPARSVFQEGRS